MNKKILNFKEKLNHINLTDYHGLKSPGLTCYLNSVLQVLFMTEDFREAIEGSCSKDSTTLDLDLQMLFKDLKTEPTRTHNITTKLGITNGWFGFETLFKILQTLEPGTVTESLNTMYKFYTVQNMSSFSVYEQHDAAEYFEKVLHLTSPGASKIFKGELNHKTSCLQCGRNNDSRSFFWMLPLVVEDSHHQTYSVDQGLKKFFKGETVSEDNRMYCNQCHEKREAKITCEITHNPEILTLLLKRFRFDNKRKGYVKLHCKVKVPQALHFESCTYDLYALVHHYGNLAGGHYTAEIKSFETGRWYFFNDDTVEMREQLLREGDTILRSCTAYLLMYRKKNSEEDEHEAQCAYSDVGAEGRFEEAARGEDHFPHHQLKEEQNNKGKNLKHFNGDISQTGHDDKVRMKHENSAGGVEKLPKERVAHQSELCGDMYLTRKSKISNMQTGEEQHKPKRQQHVRNSNELMWHLTTRGPPTEDWIAHHNNRRFEQTLSFPEERLTANDIMWERQDNIVSENRPRTVNVTNSSPTGNIVKPAATKGVKNKEDGAEVMSISQRTYTDVTADNSYVFSNGCSPHSPPTCTSRSHSQCCMNEPFVYNFSPSICKGNNVQRINKMQTFVEATQGGKTTDLRKQRKIKNKSEDNSQRQPWR